MSSTVACSRCSVPFQTDEPAAATVCPSCRKEIDLGQPEAPGDAATKTCPMCGKSIRATASLCLHCGEPQSLGGGFWRDGNLLVMRLDADLPFRCIKTNQPASGWLNRTLYWHPPSVYLFLLLGPVYLLMAALLHRCARIRVGLSPSGFVQRHACVFSVALCIALALLALQVCAATLAGEIDIVPPIWAIYAMIPMAVIVIIIALVLVRYADMVHAKRIGRKHLWLRGVHRDFLANLPDWPGEEPEE